MPPCCALQQRATVGLLTVRSRLLTTGPRGGALGSTGVSCHTSVTMSGPLPVAEMRNLREGLLEPELNVTRSSTCVWAAPSRVGGTALGAARRPSVRCAVGTVSPTRAHTLCVQTQEWANADGRRQAHAAALLEGPPRGAPAASSHLGRLLGRPANAPS